MTEKILITPKSFKTYKDKAFKILDEAGLTPVMNETGRTLTENEMIDLSQDVVGILVGVDPVTSSVLDNASKLRAISKYGSGLDNIDLKRAEELKIKVSKALGANSVSVAELAVGLMFCIARNIPHSSGSVKNGGWDRKIGVELAGKTAGVLGAGFVGREFAKRAAGLGMKVKIYDPYFNDDSFLKQYNVELSTFDEIVEIADFISLHLPLMDTTTHMINENVLKRMKNTAYIINTSRGELVDEEALYNALSSRQISGAAQDVFSSEPPTGDEKLLKLDNFILTSHIGAFTNESVEKMVVISTQNLIDMLK